MSGLRAGRARRSARGQRLRPRRLAVPGARARARASTSRRPRRRERPRRRRRRGRPLDRDPAENPERVAAARARLPDRRAPSCWASSRALKRVDRDRRRPRQDDDDLDGRPRAAGAAGAAGLPDRRRADDDRDRTPTGARGSGSSSRPTSRTARCSRSTSTSRWSPTSSSTTSTIRVAGRPRGRLRAFLAGAPERIVGRRPRAAARRGPRTFAVDELELDAPAARAFVRRGRRGASCSVPGAHNAPTPRPRWRRCARTGADLAAAAASLARLPRRRPALPARSGETAPGARGRRRLRPPPDRGRRDDRRRPHVRRPAGVVAVFQPHLYSPHAAVRREFGAALAGADVACVLDVYPAREQAEDFPGVDGADRRRRRPTPGPARGALAAGLRRRRARPARAAARGDLCLVLGAGDVDALGRRLVA